MELLRNAFTGFNLIPTLLLILMVGYWLISILGALDLDFLDFDLEGVDDAGPFYSLSIFLNIGKVPFGLVLSLLILNFWVLSMLIYFLPVEAGGMASGLLLIPALIISVYLTKFLLIPLKKIFKNSNMEYDKTNKVLLQECILMCDVSEGRLGQARVNRNGASIVVNVKVELIVEKFSKDEKAIISKKDMNQNLYYIRKIRG